MARNRVHIEAPPERVFSVLSVPERYPEWIVGAAAVVRTEGDFPAPGSRFWHRVGPRRLALYDQTEVRAVEPPRRIELKAKARPLGTADVVIELAARAGGTDVLLVETPGDRLSALVVANRLGEAALRIRNAESLARLKRIVEERPLGRPRRRRQLAGQRVLITGGSSGIGLATAEQLAAEGARLALLARNQDGLARARQRIEASTPLAEVHTFAADVRDRAALAAAVEEAAARLGGLDVLVAAAAGAAFGPFVETEAEDFDQTIATILGGAAGAIRAALPALEQSRGAIVCVGSIAARLPLPGLSAYTAAKHGLVGLLDALRIELAEAGSPVSVSLVNPGAVDTPLWDHLESQTGLLPPVPPERYAPEAIAAAVVETVRRPREEISVGGSAALQVAMFERLRRPTSLALRGLGRLAQSGDARQAPAEGGLRRGLGAGEVGGGRGGRGSLAVRALRGWDGLLRRAGAG
jgi:NAD(P)-dependent dehydrogenase (short-subunit alcohol dehydrogenase family)/uncharacterized protein YndB with AHSA1/START domain